MVEDEDSESSEQWREQAEHAKREGNALFKAGDVAGAIQLYTQAISLDPENHIYYSNRSGAYLRLGTERSRALHDAMKCVELRKDWPKGYQRLGAAELALGRHEAAQGTFKKGLRLDPDNEALKKGYDEARLAEERDLERRQAAQRAAARAEEERRKAAAAMTEGERLMSDFFAEIDEAEQKPPALPSLAELQGLPEAAGGGASQPRYTAKYKEQNRNLGTPRELVDFLLGPQHKWRNLNPYRVLKLDVDATDEDIKLRYKRLSLRIHPDKNRDMEEEATAAFEQVKAAYELLMQREEGSTAYSERPKIIARVEEAKARALEKHRSQESEGGAAEDLAALIERESLLLFATVERDRVEATRLRRANEARAAEQERAEVDKAKRAHDSAKEWKQSTRQEERVAAWRDFAGASKRPRREEGPRYG